MSSVWLLVRCEVSRRWRSLGWLTALVAIVGTIVLLGVSGARRSESALGRLLEVTRNQHVSVEVGPEYFAAIAALPQVETVAPGSFMFVFPEGLSPEGLLTIAGTDGRFGSEVNRPRLVSGRLASPERADEVVVNSVVAELLDVGVGDAITMASLSPSQLQRLIAAGVDPGEPAGPSITVTVVGVGVTAEDLGNQSPILLFTAAFYAAYGSNVGHFDDILAVRLKGGDHDVDAFREEVRGVVPDSEGALLSSLAETTREVEDATEVETLSLLAVTAVAGLAGLAAIGVALGHHVGASDAERPVLATLGMSRRKRWLASMVPVLAAVFSGSILAVVGAIAASPTMPVGFSRRVEPSPGFAADWSLLGLGLLGMLVVIAALAAAICWVASGRVLDHPVAPMRQVPVTKLLTRLAVAPAMSIGVRRALTGFGRRTTPLVRSTLFAVCAGTAGVVAALTFGAGLERAVSAPHAYGWNWDVNVRGPFQPDEVESLASELATDTAADGVAAVHVQPIHLAGVDVQSYELQVRRGRRFVTVLEGRAPAGPAEILVGSNTLDRLRADIGDQVGAAGMKGGTPRRVTIVGLGVFPEFIHPAVPESDTASYNDFALADGTANHPFANEAGGEYFGVVLVDWAPGTDTNHANSALQSRGLEVEAPNRPTNLDNLARVRLFPLLLAAMLAILVAVTYAQAVVSSTRRDADGLTLLRALGFVDSQLRITVAAHATTLATTGLLIGLPIGLVAGRLIWSTVADRIGIYSPPPNPTLAALATVLAALVVANLLAIIPAHTATRAHHLTRSRRE